MLKFIITIKGKNVIKLKILKTLKFIIFSTLDLQI